MTVVSARTAPSRQDEGPSAPPTTSRRALLAAGAGLGAAGLLDLLGPHPVGAASGRSGDRTLLARVQPHLRGLNRVAIAYVDGATTRYAGIGADQHTPFGIGSVSKTFSGAVLMDMVAQREVSLETKVGEILDAHRSELAEVSLRELASHTAGLPDFTASEAISQDIWFGLLHADGETQDAAGTVADVLAQHVTGRGTYSYSTCGIALLAHLLAHRAGTTYKQLLTQRILKPLSLTGTRLPVTQAGLPKGWQKGLLGGRPAEPWTLNGLAPGGGVWSTSADLATWLRLTRDGRQPGAAGLEPVAAAPIPPYMPEAQVAITWFRADSPGGEPMVFHNGLTGSHHAFVGYCPRTRRGLAYLVNSSPTGGQLLMLQGDLVRTLLDEGA